jgi:cell division protein FtsQ
VVFSIVLMATMYYTNKQYKNRVMQFPEIVVVNEGNNAFLMDKDVAERLKHNNIILEGLKRKDINANLIESLVLKMQEVKSASVHLNLDDTWRIRVELRQPIARIFNKNGESFYLDRDGKTMPLSPLYSARILPFTGNINDKMDFLSVEDIINTDSLKTIKLLPQIYYLSEYVCNDPFLSALITQVDVDQNGDFVLTPLVGNQKIHFGSPYNKRVVEERFKKLQVFYKEALPYTGWSTYESISLKYKNQVVCKKRE